MRNMDWKRPLTTTAGWFARCPWLPGWFARGPSPSLFSFLLLCLSIYAVYRVVACERWRWECRSKSARVSAEDVASTVLLTTVSYFFSGFDPIPADPAPAHASDSSHSSEEELPLGSVAAGTTWGSPPRGWVSFRGGLRLAGGVSAVTAAFLMGRAGEDIKEDIKGVPVGTLAPLLAVVGVALAYAATVALRKPSATCFFLLSLLAVGCFWGGAAAVAARGGGGGKGCTVLVFHAHHYLLAFSAVLLLREHGLPPPFRSSWTRLQIALGIFTWLTKNALLGIAVQGLSQYGADSVLRPTTCAATRR